MKALFTAVALWAAATMAQAVTDAASPPTAAAKAPVPDPAAAEPIIIPVPAGRPVDLRADAPVITDRGTPSELNGEEDLSVGWTLVRTLVVLGIVVMLIYLSLNFGLRKMMGLKSPMAAGGSVVSVLERIPLDQRRVLFVVKAANEYLLLGGTDTSLELVGKLDGTEVEKLRTVPTSSTALTLSPLLTKLLGRRAGERK